MLALRDATVVKPGDCFEYWHQVTCRDFSVTECRRVLDRNFRAQVSIWEFGPLAINSIWSSTTGDQRIRVTRDPSEIRKDPRDYFMLWLVLEGEAVLAQAGQQARMQTGDLVLHDQARPFALEFGRWARALKISIPRPLLTSRLPSADRLTAQRIAGQSKLGALAGSIVRHMAQLEDTIDQEVVRRLGASALDIFATTLEAELTGQVPAHGLRESRLAKVKKYMLDNLHDAELNLDTIAKTQHMAPRTLNRLFASEGTTPMRWLWQQRLAASFKALAEGRVSQVAEAASGFGFGDPSHFSRTFKAAFGRSPTDIQRHGMLRP